jgi:hypothetical protein
MTHASLPKQRQDRMKKQVVNNGKNLPEVMAGVCDRFFMRLFGSSQGLHTS